MYDVGLYDNFLQRQSAQYSFSGMTRTMVACGVFLLNTSTSFLPIPSRDGLSVNKYGSDEYVINHLYSSDSPTWSDIESSYGSSGGSHDEIKDSFTVLAGLAFLEGDAIAEKEADQFFSRVQVKTRKIMVTKKA